jgi:polar amino acid transport system substrate-binding protein
MNGLKLYLFSLSFWTVPLWASQSVSNDLSIPPQLELNYLVIVGQSAPLQMLDDEGKAIGIVSDLVETIVADHHPLTVTRLPFKRLLHEINSGRKKNWISYGASSWSSPQGKNIVDCEIHRAHHSTITFKPNSGISNAQGLSGKSLILMHGFHFPELEAEFTSGNIGELRVKNYHSAFKSLEAERAAAFVEMDLRIRYNLNATNRDINNFNITDFSEVIPPYSIYLSLDPDMPRDTRDFLTQRCQQLKNQGYIDALHKKYQP